VNAGAGYARPASPDSINCATGAISAAMPRKKDTPRKLADRMKRRWRVVLLRHKGEVLGQVEGSRRGSG